MNRNASNSLRLFSRFGFISLGFALLLPGVSLRAAGQLRPDLTGNVTDSAGQPVKDAQVFIYTAGPKEGAGVLCPSCYADCRKKAATDAEGKFKIESLDPALIFRVLVVGKDSQPQFVGKVDPAVKPLSITLKAAKTSDSPKQQLHGRVLDPEGKPIAGAVVNIRGVKYGESTHFGGNSEVDPVAVSDENGEFVIRSTKDFDGAGLDIEARTLAKGVFPTQSSGTNIHVFKLSEGATLTGRLVKDGKPLVGKEVGLAGVNRESSVFVGEFSVGTDKDGRFTFVNMPAETEYQFYGIMKSLGQDGAVGSRKLRLAEVGSTKDLGDVAVQPGLILAGKLKLSDGKALPAKTRVMLSRAEAWDNAQAVLDADGSFRFVGVPAEEVDVSANVKGYRLSARNASLDPSGGYALVGRMKSSKTNLVVELEPGERRPWESGNYEAREAIRQEVLRGAEGGPAPKGDIQVTGTVVDAETGKPLPTFTVTEGREDRNMRVMAWLESRAIEFTNGTFEVSFNKQGSTPALLVEAEGYLPQASGPIGIATTNLTFSLIKGHGPGGVLLDPAGKPLAGVEVYLTDMKNGVYVEGDPPKVRADIYRGSKHVPTDTAGRFSFKAMEGAHSIIVVANEGFLEQRVSELKDGTELRLQPWGRVEGRLLIGTKPGAGETVHLWPAHVPYEDYPRQSSALNLFAKTQTDTNGNFVFAHVPPLRVEVYHEPKVRDGNMGITPMSQTEKFAVKAGATNHLTLGGRGRPVIGKFVVEGYEGEINWRADVQSLETVQTSPPELPDFSGMMKDLGPRFQSATTDEEKAAVKAEYDRKQAEYAQKTRDFYASPPGWDYYAGQHRYALNFAKDGSFRIDDVPGGKYRMRIDLREAGENRFSAPRIASLQKEIEVPDAPGGRSDEPLDLGTIELQSRKSLKVGKAAPDFEVKTLDDKTIKLSDLAGKYVLLDFWATWCGPCVAETPSLKAAYDAAKDDPRFQIVGLSLDQSADAPRAYAKKNGIQWTQGFLGDWSKADLPNRYGVEGIPAIFLIGPDGKIIATGLRGEQIKEAVLAALKKS